MDLMCIIPGTMGFVYKAHLPLLGWEASSNDKIDKTEETQYEENGREVLKIERERKSNAIQSKKGNSKQEKQNKGKNRGKLALKKAKDSKQSKTTEQESSTSSGGDKRSNSTFHSEVRTLL